MKTALFIFSMLAMHCSFAEPGSADVTPERQNELLYFVKHDCGSCHGMTLKGGLGPALLPEALTGKPKAFLVTTIMEGRKNTAMPPWKSMLSENEAIWITEQLLNGKAAKTELAHSRQPYKNQPQHNRSGSKP